MGEYDFLAALCSDNVAEVVLVMLGFKAIDSYATNGNSANGAVD